MNQTTRSKIEALGLKLATTSEQLNAEQVNDYIGENIPKGMKGMPDGDGEVTTWALHFKGWKKDPAVESFAKGLVKKFGDRLNDNGWQTDDEKNWYEITVLEDSLMDEPSGGEGDVAPHPAEMGSNVGYFPNIGDD